MRARGRGHDLSRGSGDPRGSGRLSLAPRGARPAGVLRISGSSTPVGSPPVSPQEKRERYREMADWCIDQRHIESGQHRPRCSGCLAAAVPAMVTMELLGECLSRIGRTFAEPVSMSSSTTPPDEPGIRELVVAEVPSRCCAGDPRGTIEDRERTSPRMICSAS